MTPPDPAGSAVLRALIASRASDASSFVATIHPDDEMFLAELTGACPSHERAAVHYYLKGREIFDTVSQLARFAFGGLANVGSFLDFACGHGRLTRFVVERVPAARVWSADIYASAVAFQTDAFGVHALRSAAEPSAFDVDATFDFVFVASLFSHLPQATFAGWLRRLFELLSPRGLLVFSVHDIRLTPPELRHDGDFAFVPESESRSLAAHQYGTAYASRAFVEAAIDRAASPAAPRRRIREGLCGFQDLYVVSRDRHVDLSALICRRGPEGCLDGCRREPGGGITLGGWAFERAAGERVAMVEVSVDGAVAATAPCDQRRPDVAAHFGDQRAGESGWICRVPPERVTAGSAVLVRAASTTGLDTVFAIDLVEDLPAANPIR